MRSRVQDRHPWDSSLGVQSGNGRRGRKGSRISRRLNPFCPPVSDRTTQVARRTISKAGRRESWNETVVDKQAPSRLICLLSGLLSNCTLLVNKETIDHGSVVKGGMRETEVTKFRRADGTVLERGGKLKIDAGAPVRCWRRNLGLSWSIVGSRNSKFILF